MSGHPEKKSGGVQWGGLIKGLMGAAAIVAGIMICCPALATSVISAIGSIGTTTATTTAGNAGVGWLNSQIGSGIGTLLTKAAGIAIAYFGYKAMTSDSS